MTATLSEIFATTVARFPERVALSAGDLTYTYRELDMRAAATANALAGEGVRPGDLVGVLADRGPSAAIGLLAILRLGAAYVPLDPSHPAERVRFILDDSRVRVVVGPTAGAKALDSASGSSIRPFLRRLRGAWPPLRPTTRRSPTSSTPPGRPERRKAA